MAKSRVMGQPVKPSATLFVDPPVKPEDDIHFYFLDPGSGSGVTKGNGSPEIVDLTMTNSPVVLFIFCFFEQKPYKSSKIL